MAYYNKIGLLILNDDQTKFLVCEPGEKYEEKTVTQFLMPGGQLEEDSDEECLKREIKEELDCNIDLKSIEFIKTYDGPAAFPGRDVMIKLYKGKILGKPKPSSEIGALHWVSEKDLDNPRLSPITNIILKDLIKKGIIK